MEEHFPLLFKWKDCSRWKDFRKWCKALIVVSS
jgi:hypothetical protein